MKECLELIKNGKNLNDYFTEKYLLYIDANNLIWLGDVPETTNKKF